MQEEEPEIIPIEDEAPIEKKIRLLEPSPGPRAIRTQLQEMVAKDLLGPAQSPDEEIPEKEAQNVRDRYILGVLAPRHRVEREETATAFDELAQDGGGESDDGSPDTGAPQKGTMFPSSIGLTFHVDGTLESISLTASWGRYERVDSQLYTNDKGDPQKVWRRVPVERTMRLPLRKGRVAPWAPDEDTPEVIVQGIVRRKEGERDWTVTLFLVNGQREPKTNRDAAWLFQVGLAVATPGERGGFVQRNVRREKGKLDAEVFRELKALEMHYRLRAEFAVGHGIAVHAEADPADPLRATRILTSALPTLEVAPVEPAVVPDLLLDMKALAETPPTELADCLRPLVTAYADWIAAQKEKAKTLPEFDDAARLALESCDIARQRIDEGIALLASDPNAAEAFRFANRAMWLQRVHSIYAESVRRGKTVERKTFDVPQNRSWRPFQLAFVLLNLPGVTRLDHAERSELPSATADLLWFPTGGGKTEAYLGLTAYTLGLRRLQGVIEGRSGEHGVAVLMRYTLRLLTLQQFQRAAALICACEAIRRDAAGKGDDRWGRWPFRIGLWVGKNTTPNSTEQSEQAILDRRDRKYTAGLGDPAQLTTCPWCGTVIEPGKHLKIDKARGRTLTYCGDALGRCPFSAGRAPDEGLPVIVVDEEIYHQLPSLLIATVDKFAQMPWNGVTQMLFGKVDSYSEKQGFGSPDLPVTRSVESGSLRPPDLIIQDELHLISGPLGSMVGLYETAVDYLSTWEVGGRKVRPKVIASTATIRNARLQVHKTFRRHVFVFPPQGLDVEDNFFALQSDLAEKPGRLYVGVCAPGRRLKSVLIRVYIAYMAAAQALFERYGAEADPWMTTVGYFNSMRELGGMRRLVDDDVRSGLGHTDKRNLPKRRVRNVRELTSRMSSADIPKTLDNMEVTHTGDREAALPIDVLLATNMISVGVDVKRLGLMIVANQPKTTAEYIQATSRVGRSHPGLVCTVLNWARPRDLSHYERFEHYHATFYQFVEALSVTPFAPRALDRGISALLVATVRLSGRLFNSNASAADIQPAHDLVQTACAAIARHAAEAEGSNEVGDRVKAELQTRLDTWKARAQQMTGGSILGYKTRKDGKTFGLLEPAGSKTWQEFTCLNSLRDVEPSVNLILDNYGMDDVLVAASAPGPSEPTPGDEDDLLL